MGNDNYKPTQLEIKEFAIHKKYGVNINNQTSVKPKKKPTNGKLMYEDGNYKELVPGTYDKPMALLNSIKSKMVANGYDKKKLKIRYL